MRGPYDRCALGGRRRSAKTLGEDFHCEEPRPATPYLEAKAEYSINNHSEKARAPHKRTLGTYIQDLGSGIILVGEEGAQKQGECGEFLVNGRISNPRYRLRPLPTALLVVHRK